MQRMPPHGAGVSSWLVRIAPVLACLCGIVAWAQDYQKDVAPFLQKYCTECHDQESAKGHLDLESIKDDTRMFKDQRMWRDVLNQVVAGEMPPAKKKVRPSTVEIEQLQGNIRRLLGRAIAGAKVDPGTVTIRRLNRTEYNNTIRDLCYVEGNFAADFPADDTGYGFDNIGDVLSFSPIHLERFIAVGEQVAAKAMPSQPPELDGTGLAMIEMLPRGRREEQQRYFDPTPSLTGSMEAPRDGEYIVSVNLRSTGTVGDPLAQVAVVVDGVEAGKYVFKSIRKSEVVEVKVPLKQGRHEFTLKWLNPPANIAGNKRSLSGLRLRLLGPTDTRTELQRRLAVLVGDKKGELRARLIANWFVSRAFRRPATPAELQRYVKAFTAAEQTEGNWEAGAQAMIRLVLSSPKFIFRAEQDEKPTATEPHPISEFALASRLSYFLWGSMPDEELFNLAYAGKLSSNLAAQARRMLQDARSQFLVQGFALQWLQLRQLSIVSPDPKKYEDFNETIRVAMSKETEFFLAEIVREDRSVLEIIDANFTYVNRPLAEFYGLTYPVQDAARRREEGGFRRVTLPPGERGGVLTQASILTATSNPDRTSPVKRGKWILEQILGTPPPPAPAEVPSLESQQALHGTLRERMEQHRKDPACASCHTRMDAIGFALERFDGIGRARTEDEGKPIDPSGKLPDGRKFAGAAELKQILKADKERFVTNLSTKLLTYGLGRGVEYYDGPAIDRIAAEALKGEPRFSTLVLGVVLSDPFRLRRGTSQVENGSEKPKKK